MGRITHPNPKKRIPPLDSHKELDPAEITLLQRWVEEGAKFEEYWSYIPPKRSELHRAGDSWARKPIDRSVAETLASGGLIAHPVYQGLDQRLTGVLPATLVKGVLA
jgi:hypothetical protein